MSKAALLDASAVMAFLLKEPGATTVEKYLADAVISAVNYSEVMTCLLRLNIPYPKAEMILKELALHIVAFDHEQALATAALQTKTSVKGLSLGDRACLALAKAQHLPVLTADQAWKDLSLGIKIVMIR